MLKNLLRRGLLSLALMLAVSPAFAVVTYSTAVKNARLDALTTAAGTNPKMKFICADGTTIGASLNFSGALAAAASGGTLTLNVPTASTALTGCTFTTMKITTSADVDVIAGFTVGSTGSGQNFIFNNATFSSSQNVTVTGFTISHP